MIYLRLTCLIASVFFFLESTYAVSLSQASATIQGEQVILTLQFNKGANARYAFGSIYPTVNNYGLGYRMNANCSVSDNQVGIGVVRSIGCQRALFPQGNFLFNVAVIDVSSNPPPPGYRIDKTISVPIDNTPKLISINLPTVITVSWLPLRGIISFPGGGQFASATHKGNATLLIDIKNNANPTQTISFTFSTLNGFGALPNEIDLSKQYMNIAQLIDGDYTAKIRARAINGAIASTTLNFQIKRSPNVYIALDKTQAPGCETLTGSLTVNDPSGQGGTVALTLPDGTPSNFTYAGSAPAPIPFSYAVSEPVGSTLTFSATASSNSGASSKQPATATANVIAGGLNVTITPAKTVVEPTLNNLRKRLQKAGANKTSVTINVTDPNNQPVTNAQFTVLGVETVPGTETYGGHDHAVDANNALTKPTGTWGTIKNLGNGQYLSTYTASMFASKEQLYATVSANGCETLATSQPIEAKIQGLQPIILPLRGLVHSFVGGTCNHYGAATPWNPSKLAGCNGTTGTSNRYLTAFRENLLHKLLFAYAKEWNAGLYINDASLEFGGAFDTNGNWAYKPHSNHRLGLDVDIALKENKPPLGTKPTGLSGKTLKRKLESIILSDPILRGNWVASLHKNHIHLKPNFDNWRGK